MCNELLTCSRLLDIVARKLGHDWLLLVAGTWSGEEKWSNAAKKTAAARKAKKEYETYLKLKQKYEADEKERKHKRKGDLYC